MTQWYGMLAPASLPQAHAEKLQAMAAQAVKSPAAVKLLESEAAIPIGGSSADFVKFIAAEQARWKPVIARAKIKPD
jgi:tripartite-type tricarboxylate transporter receptor subunit TctC